ncbi:MAG TPA: site-specific integrase [Nitrospiraceae bacterium]|nr:site-specific integrase [Nitrospiraceae bacterium]
MTIGDFLVVYERNHVVFLKNRLGTSRRLHTYVGQLAAIELEALTKMQVLEWFHAIGQAKGGNAANQALQQLHSMYVKAEEWELFTGKNPAHRIKKFPKHSRERFIQSNELPWLLKSLADEHPRTEIFFLCLLLTGARRDEARTMQWKDLDLDRALWHKPTTKTGVPHTIPLPAQLVTRLRQLPRINEWVFPSSPNSLNGMRAGLWSGTAVEHAWQKIRRRVGLNDVRIHDLRRTAASWLSIHGSNLQVIQSMLNHRSLSSTQVYARLSLAPVALALNDQCERMLGPVPTNPPLQQTPQWSPSRGEEREQWPG